jgi:hypothetical protein
LTSVTVAVAPGRVPAWHGWCIEALRTLPEVETRVVVAARALDGGDVDGVDLVVDLARVGGAVEPPLGFWRIVLGASDDAARPFAREIAAGARTFEIALVRRLDGREDVLRSGRFPLTEWYPSAVRLALTEAARWPGVMLNAMAADAFALRPAQGDKSAGKTAGKSAGGAVRFRFYAVLAGRFARALYDELFEIVEWNVGFVDGDARQLLADAPLAVRWLPAPAPETLIADPFVVARDCTTALFVEAFDYRGARGAIDVLVLAADGTVAQRMRALDAPTHLSYPYPVQIDGELYLVPENCEGNEVALYRCVRFPDRWEREVPIFPAFDGVDTTLFEHGGAWWAFCTRYSHGANVALFAFHAASPRGPWTAHALNPIVCDVSCARPAGQPFAIDGVWYRPGQDCSQSYGGGLALARIDALTPTDYRETIVRRVSAKGLGRWGDGMHTLSFMPGALVIDGKRTYRSWRKLAWALPRLLARIARRLGQGSRVKGGLKT